MTPDDIAAMRIRFGLDALPPHWEIHWALKRALDALEAHVCEDWEVEHDKWLNAECDLTQARKERDAALAALDRVTRWGYKFAPSVQAEIRAAIEGTDCG